MNFQQPWTEKFAAFDTFYDCFSNLLIFHNEGYFVIWEEFQHQKLASKVPFKLNLATT